MGWLENPCVATFFEILLAWLIGIIFEFSFELKQITSSRMQSFQWFQIGIRLSLTRRLVIDAVARLMAKVYLRSPIAFFFLISAVSFKDRQNFL